MPNIRVFFFLEEATKHFRQAYPELVRVNSESILSAFARMFKIFHKQRSIGSSNASAFIYTQDRHSQKMKEI